MGNISSIEKYTSSQVQVSKLAKAMGHPARIAILELLAESDCTCNDIVECLPLSQSTVSQHLKELKNAELISGQEIPPKIIYSINMTNYKNFKNILEDIF